MMEAFLRQMDERDQPAEPLLEAVDTAV
jgi:hypothetical protein